jgi:glutamate-5-semialdehyde dehydrogenase
MTVLETARRAKSAAGILASSPTEQKNQALSCLALALLAASDEILEANLQDLAEARNAGLSPAMLDRLMLNHTRLQSIAADLSSVAELPDPVGQIFEEQVMPNGLRVHKQRVPLGVLGVIYEARPNVTVDVSGLALKSGNAAILRGGSETIRSNRAFTDVIQRALGKTGLPVDAIQFIDDPDRQRVLEMLQAADWIDLIIPRGGAELHRFCRENSHIPVMTGGLGICHLFLDESADLEASLPLIENAKIQRPTVCNALDTLLVHREVAKTFLPRLVERLYAKNVTFRADESALPIVAGLPGVSPAGQDDFDTEWLSLVLGLKVVEDIDAAIRHIQQHSTAHSDGILTQNQENARRFIALVDSAAVYVNASTRFTDGSQLGLGAEVAISTQRLHARGPMALRELTTYKWVIQGEYQVRA